MVTKKGDSRFWVVGGGKFGTKAVERLFKKRPEAVITVIDKSAEALEDLRGLPAEKVCQEGVDFLAHELQPKTAPDWIVPAVPVHLAFEWVCAKISMGQGKLEIVQVPYEVEAVLPNPIRGPEGQLFVSYADFVCPNNCKEPFDRCTFTGKPRKGLLYKRLEEISFDGFTSVVVRSRQLAPGVGGYRPRALEESLQRVRGLNGRILYGTACLCHGVVHAVKLSSLLRTDIG